MPRFRSRLPGWPLIALLMLSVLVPMALFAWTAWSSRVQQLEDAEQTAVRTVTALHEHMVKVLETHEAILNEMTRRVQGRSWGDLENDEDLRADLASRAQDIDQILTISVIDAQGQTRLSSVQTSTDLPMVADRDYFEVAMTGDNRTFISGPRESRLTGEPAISLSRRLQDADGQFQGVVVVAVPISYFTTFWEQFAPTIAHIVPLVRADGQVIARYPAENNPAKLELDGPFLGRALREPQGVYTAASLVDGVERLNAYSQVADYPLFISFSIEVPAILARWYESMTLYGAYTVLATIALLGMALMALRQYRYQQSVSQHWRHQADRLAEEIDRREKAEASLRQAQKMEVVGQITGGVAHDFNNLLQAMQSSLYLLSPKLPADARPIVEATEQAVDRGAKLVRQLMAFSRRQQLEPQPIDVQSLVLGMADLLQKAVGDGVRIELEVPPDVSPLLADPTQTEMAILNLAINARDAMNGRGHLTISARDVTVTDGEIAAMAPGDYVVLSIADTGCGMPQAVAERAFDPFFTTKVAGKGTGLGLSMVHGFVNQSGGAASIESHPGHGTTVNLYLPKSAEAPQDRALPVRAVQPATAGETILLVDDEALARNGVAMVLREMGYSVLEARNGHEALDLLTQDSRIDLLITDYSMPGLQGTELAAASREVRPDVKIIMITGHAAFSFDERTAGVARILRKPFAMADLIHRITTILESPPMTAPVALRSGGKDEAL